MSTDPEPFYKFKEPCNHELYRKGDSWCEELRFSAEEFDSALKRIGTQITKGVSKAQAFEKDDPTGLIIYWTDTNRMTWYTVNVGLVDKLLSTAYLLDRDSRFTFSDQKILQNKEAPPLCSRYGGWR